MLRDQIILMKKKNELPYRTTGYQPKKIDLDKINFNLEALLRQRGKIVISQGFLRIDTLAADESVWNMHGLEEELYKYMNQKSNREAMQKAIQQAQKIKMPFDITLDYDAKSEIKYSKTFEWYVAQILINEFHFYSAGFGLKIKDAPNGGDYDVIGVSQFHVVHIECKSGNAANITKENVENFIKRSQFLNAEISIMYTDRKRVNSGQGKFRFNDIFKSFPGFTDGTPVYSINPKGSSVRVYHPRALPMFIVDCGSSTGSAVENIRLAIDLHYKMKRIMTERISFYEADLKLEGFDVALASEVEQTKLG